MTPNTQMHQAMVAAAAMAQGRTIVHQEPRVRQLNAAHESESGFTVREPRSSPELPTQVPEVKHARRISESSMASSGFVSNGSPASLPTSPQKYYCKNNYVMTSQVSNSAPFSNHSALRPSSTPRSFSPASSVSDNDSESLWRPW